MNNEVAHYLSSQAIIEVLNKPKYLIIQNVGNLFTSRKMFMFITANIPHGFLLERGAAVRVVGATLRLMWC